MGFSEVYSTNKLRPECRRAIEVLGESLKNWQQYYCEDVSFSVIEHDSKCFFNSKISKDRLPETTEWGWNQSNGKQTVILDLKFSLELFKYNPIRKNPSARKPSYKLWLGVIKVLHTSEIFTFSWCEKGFKSEEEPLSLKDLSFLAQFTDPITRQELGWG